ncbi:MAG TPA: HIT domain-containing protein [Candidatus Limnocylindrales bacterium]
MSTGLERSRTWPADWETRKTGAGCPMCAEGRPEVNEYGTRRVWAGRYADAYLKRTARPLGYTFVVWRGRHVSEPTELTDEEAAGYWLEVLRVGRGIERRYAPAKLNLQVLGNAVPHLHTHVVPRYLDDPDPERPPAFASAETEELEPARYDAEAEALAAAIRAAASQPQ